MLIIVPGPCWFVIRNEILRPHSVSQHWFDECWTMKPGSVCQNFRFHYPGWWFYCNFAVLFTVIRIPCAVNLHGACFSVASFCPGRYFLHKTAALFPQVVLTACYCYLCLFLPASADAQAHPSLAQQREHDELSWGPDVVGLSVGSQQQSFPLGELPEGIRPVYSPPIINTAGKPTPYCYCCLLLFIFCPCLQPHLWRP